MLSLTIAALFGSLAQAAQQQGWQSGQQAPAWQTKNSQRMRLVGTSFGVTGQNATFDYVVVGGGTAGLAIASRLAKQYSVAVIEAGSFYEADNGNISQVPISTFQYDTQTPYLTDWNIKTGPEPGYNNRTLYYARGRCLGGSSGLNAQVYQRPTVGSMDVWANLVGDNSWKWSNVLPFFKKSCAFTPPQLDKFTPKVNVSYDPSAYDQYGGPLQVSYAHYQQDLTPGWARGFQKIGLNETRDQVSGVLNGWGFPALTNNPDYATRESSESSFLQRAFALRPNNIQVYHHAFAKRILFDSTKKATGVEVTVQGSIEFKFTLSARNEVILSAGALQSPQLLMVSGIGPAATLQKYNIPVIANRPGVGQNMQDHAWFFTTYKVNVLSPGSELDNNSTYRDQAVEQYLTQQNGPLSNIGADIIGWEKLPAKNRQNLSPATLKALAAYPQDWPEFEYLGIAAPSDYVPDDAQYASFTFILLTPQSRGGVTIASNDMSTQPVVRFNYLTNKTDQEIVVQATRRIREWANATGNAIAETIPGPQVQTDAQILDYLRQSSTFIYHAACTCAMGKPDDPQAVVDTRARVYGVQGLRVVDASAFPILPPGHPQSTVYMLAEKIAADILNGTAPSSAAKSASAFSDDDY